MDTPQEKEPPSVITSDTDNATTIQPSEAPPGKRSKFRRFRAYNTGTWNGPKRENKDVVHRQDNLHRYDSLSSSLNLSDYQKSRGRKLLDGLNVGKMGICIDAVIFGICVLVANQDVPDGCRYHPNTDKRGDASFVVIADQIDIDKSEQLSAIEKVRSRVNL